MTNKDLKLFYDQIRIHVEMLVDERMRAHAYADVTHDLHFQVFRLITGYEEALNQLAEEQLEKKHLYEKYKDALNRIIELEEEIKNAKINND